MAGTTVVLQLSSVDRDVLFIIMKYPMNRTLSIIMKYQMNLTLSIAVNLTLSIAILGEINPKEENFRPIFLVM